ncbi:hypothetical protein V8C86DRAFT_2520340 [Haematococcus lacustris]
MGWLAQRTHVRFKYRKRTRTVIPALEEHYLRNDMGCGVEACPACLQRSLPPTFAAVSPALFLLLPDADVLLQFLDVWELAEMSNWVLCSSVVRKFALHANLRKLARLRSLYRDRRRRIHLFDNLHCAAAAAWVPGAPPPAAGGRWG